MISPSIAAGSRITTCGIYRLVGGLNKFGVNSYAERAVINLPPHYSARIRVWVLKLDSWDGEYFYIRVDGSTIIKSEQFQWNSDDSMTGNQCGDARWNEAERTYSEVFSHSATSLTVRFYTNLNSAASDESWGFNRFELLIYKCDPTCKTCTSSASNTCTACTTNAALASGVCTCNTG